MTIEQAIFLVDELKPNQIERERKIEWLARLDQRLFEEVLKIHEPDERTPEAFVPYTQETDGDTALLAPAPYDEVYRFYLEMHIDLANLEYDKYNNSAKLYANALGQYKRWYHRNHRPRPRCVHHRF
ncbi:MAG: hypothetical protein IKQ41_11760 [Clostridia bacterium]|nr:hypothetical protein [Clostridia bacterium]